MLMTRHAHTLIQSDLTYANCKFEGMYHHHMMAMFSTVETIILQRNASEAQNLGITPTPAYTPKPRGTPTGGQGRQAKGKREGNSWQRKERASEVHANATVADQGDMASLQAAIGDYENTTTVFTSKNKVWCAPATPYAKAQCTNCSKVHWIDTPCARGPQNSDVEAELRHSSLLKDMRSAMKAGTFKRLTHRFQGGKNGLRKLTSHKKVLAAVTKIVADNGAGQSAKYRPRSKLRRSEHKAEKKAAQVRAAAAAVAAAEAESSDDDSGTDGDDPLTPVVLSQARRVGRTPGCVQSRTAPRAQRQQCSTSTTGTVRSNAVTVTTVKGWRRMAITGARLARMRATLRGATVQRLRARQQREAQDTLQEMVTGHVARHAVRL